MGNSASSAPDKAKKAPDDGGSSESDGEERQQDGEAQEEDPLDATLRAVFAEDYSASSRAEPAVALFADVAPDYPDVARNAGRGLWRTACVRTSDDQHQSKKGKKNKNKNKTPIGEGVDEFVAAGRWLQEASSAERRGSKLRQGGAVAGDLPSMVALRGVVAGVAQGESSGPSPAVESISRLVLHLAWNMLVGKEPSDGDFDDAVAACLRASEAAAAEDAVEEQPSGEDGTGVLAADALHSQFPGLGSIFCAYALDGLTGVERAQHENLPLRNSKLGVPSRVAFYGLLVSGSRSLDRLYSADTDGCALSRLLAKSDGYSSATLVVVKATAVESLDGSDGVAEECVFGVLLRGPLKSSIRWAQDDADLLALHPHFSRYPSTAEGPVFAFARGGHSATHKDRNVEEGLGLGGVEKKFRIFVDADLASGKFYHWFSDKKFAPGPMFGPDQGYSPGKFTVANVELWGFGGDEAAERQSAHQTRQLQISEQRRKVDRTLLADEWKAGGGDRALLDMVSSPTSHESAADIRKQNRRS